MCIPVRGSLPARYAVRSTAGTPDQRLHIALHVTYDNGTQLCSLARVLVSGRGRAWQTRDHSHLPSFNDPRSSVGVVTRLRERPAGPAPVQPKPPHWCQRQNLHSLLQTYESDLKCDMQFRKIVF
jgi:hypothetical protein